MVTAATTAQIQATSSDVVLLCLLTFSLPGFDSLRVVNNSVDIVSRGQTYTAYPFRISLPNDDSERLPTVTLQIDNVAGEIMDYIRSLPEAPTLLLEVVSTIDLNVVEKSVGFLKLQAVSYDAMTVSGTLTLDNYLTRRFPASDYDAIQFPAIFSI